MGGQVVGCAAGSRGQQHAITHQFFHLHRTIDQDSDVRGLVGLPQQGNFVDRKRRRLVSRFCFGVHLQGMQGNLLGCVEALQQVFFLEPIHEETDLAGFHTVDRQACLDVTVQGPQHKPVASKRHDDAGIGEGTLPEPLEHPFECFFTPRSRTRNEMNAGLGHSCSVAESNCPSDLTATDRVA